MDSPHDMIGHDEATSADDAGRGRGESGATLVLTAAVLIVLMGMAAFAIDLGYLYWQTTRAQKAAESAALAGVVNLPLPSGVSFPTSDAYTAAIDVASRNGFSNDAITTVTPSQVVTHPNRLAVTVDSTAPTFFMKAFGIDTVSFSRSATAETLPPLRIGGDSPFLGEDPTDPSRNTDLWLAINGDKTGKGQGDPYTPECYGPSTGDCSGSNFEFQSPSYWYAFDVPQSLVGQPFRVEVYDGNINGGSVPRDIELDSTGYNDADDSSQLRFRLFAPDQTPSDPTDNNTVVCSRTYYGDAHPFYDPAADDAWSRICNNVAAQRGIYVLELRQTGNVDLINAFSIRSVVNGSTSSDVDVYALGAMSIWTPEANSSPTFRLVRLDEIYKGTQLIVSLWDPGDIGKPGTISFAGSLSGIDCDYRVLGATGNVLQNWTADDGGGSSCLLSIAVQEHNNEWLEIRFNIPPGYTCPGSCWSNVNYGFSGSTNDRTTWAARINGGPIHLIP